MWTRISGRYRRFAVVAQPISRPVPASFQPCQGRHSEVTSAIAWWDFRGFPLVSQGGRWTLDGMDLMDAAATAARRRTSGDLGDRSMDALAFVSSRPLGTTRAADLAAQLGIDAKTAGTNLSRLYESGRIANLSAPEAFTHRCWKRWKCWKRSPKTTLRTLPTSLWMG